MIDEESVLQEPKIGDKYFTGDDDEEMAGSSDGSCPDYIYLQEYNQDDEY